MPVVEFSSKNSVGVEVKGNRFYIRGKTAKFSVVKNKNEAKTQNDIRGFSHVFFSALRRSCKINFKIKQEVIEGGKWRRERKEEG